VQRAGQRVVVEVRPRGGDEQRVPPGPPNAHEVGRWACGARLSGPMLSGSRTLMSADGTGSAASCTSTGTLPDHHG
jgi:hypothetical protein